ncbi:hypothetical protein [Caudoviricetes sp.]|nr:hypothetical protein [Caudoviricetes sp.]
MNGPINYNIDVKNPFEEYAKGLQLGGAVRQMQTQQAQEAQIQADLQALSKNPTARGMLEMATRYPAFSKQLATPFEMLSVTEQKASKGQIAPVWNAVSLGQNKIAANALRQQSLAAKNAGKESDAEQAETLASMLEGSPEEQKAAVNQINAAALGLFGVDDYARMANLQNTLNKSQADAQSAMVGAAYAPSVAASELAEQQAKATTATAIAQNAYTQEALKNANIDSQINKRTSDKLYNKLNYDLKAAEAQWKKEMNTLKQEELGQKIKQLKTDIAVAEQNRTAEGQAMVMANQSMLGTLDKLLQTPEVVVRAAQGPVDSRLPTVQQDVADYEEQINLLKSEAFLAQLPFMIGKGAGSLSDKEGEALTNSIGNLSLRQSKDAQYANLQRIKNLLTKGQKFLADKYRPVNTEKQQEIIEVDF